MLKKKHSLFSHVEDHFSQRVAKSWCGGHILKRRPYEEGDIVMMSNDYLDVSANQQVIDAEIAALRRVGHGAPQSRVFQFLNEDSHRQFEKRMARVLGTEDAVLCQSGYDANLCVMESFARKEFPVFVDSLAHASLWKGCISAGVSPVTIRHNDPKSLKRKIEEHGSGLVVIDAVYSTNGSLCKLEEIAAICSESGCALIVDETHSFGLHGPKGAGLTQSLKLANDVDFQLVGLSKAFASRGGIIAGAHDNMEFIRVHGFPAIFSTQVMVHEVAGYDAALDVIEKSDFQRQTVFRLHKRLRDGCDAIGYNVDHCDTQIVRIESGYEPVTVGFRNFIQERRLFGSIYAWPATSMKRSLIRFTVNTTHTEVEIDKALETLADAFHALGAADWPSTKRKNGYQPTPMCL